MGFVRTGEEVQAIQRALGAAAWRGRWLTVQFLTDPATVVRLLPPGLEPYETPLAIATVGRWESSCLGDFAGGVLSFVVRRGDEVGGYPLAMFMDSEPSLTFGRDLFGEPKKLGRVALSIDGDRVHGAVERNGTTLIEMDATIGEDRGPSKVRHFAFNFRSRTAPGGGGLDGDAVLTRTVFESEFASDRRGEGNLTLRGSVHDPLDEVEVLEVRRAQLGEEWTSARCEAVETVPAEDFLPFHYGRQDDWLALDTMAPAESVERG